MDLTAQTVHSVPGAPLTQTDVSVVQDEGVLTNVAAPSLTRVLNPTAIALDNPAGTGAPFDKKDQVYKVYQRWPEKSTFINGATGAGSELVRISLNPMTLPPRIVDWVRFHRSCIPAIDVVIAIGGAAGTISWLVLGWLGDDTEEATLDSIQQISCEHINMNNTAVMRFTLNDNRRQALYRELPIDSEKWPCMVLMVNHPALNVQRNDDVSYPIDVYVRLAPNAIFMEPFNVVNIDSDVATTVDLSYYLKLETVDLLIGGSNVNNVEKEMKDLPDAGWTSGNFTPHFTDANLVCARCPLDTKYHEVFYTTEGDNPPVEDLNEAWKRLSPEIKVSGYPLPDRVAFGFGKVPERLIQAPWRKGEETPPGGWGGTMYAIPEMRLTAGAIHYWCNQIVVYEFGCILILQCRMQARSNTFAQYDVLSDTWDRQGTFFPFYTNAPGEDEFVIHQAQKGDKVYMVKYGPGIALDNYAYVNLSVAVEPQMDNRFYTFTYTLMSNNTPSSSVPVGTKMISIVRPGTNTNLGTSNTAFWPVLAPDLRGLKLMMERLRERLNTQWLQMDVEFNAEQLGTIAYTDGVMVCRSQTSMLIAVGLNKRILLRNIRAIANPSSMNNFNLEKFGEWARQGVTLGLKPDREHIPTRPRFADVPMQRESAGMVIGGVAGLTNGIYDFFQQWQRNQWMKEYQQKQLDMMSNLEKMRGENARMLEDERFRNRMAMLGVDAPSRNNSPSVNSVSTQSGGSTTSIGINTSTLPAPSPSTNMSTGTTTDIRGPENLNRPEYNRDNEFGRPPAWMRGAVPTPFKQADNISKGFSQGNVSDSAPGPQTTKESEEPLPGYAAFDPTSIGLPPEELEEFIRGDPKRTAFRVPNKQEEEYAPPIPPPMPERLLEPGTSGTQNFDRNDVIRQPIRRKEKATPEENLPMPNFERSLDHETQMPYDFLRYDDMRIGKRDFTGSKYAPQQFNRGDPLRQGARSYPQSTFGKQMFNRGDPARQPSRNISSEYFPPQQFIRGDVTRTARRDFSGLPFASATQTQATASPSTMTTERLL